MIENFTPADWNTRSPYTQVKRIDLGNCYMLFVSGTQPAADADKVVLTDDVAEQTRLVFEEISRSLSLAGASIDDVVKAVIYVTDMNDFNAISQIRNEYFKDAKPTSTLVEVNGFTRKGAKVEIEVTAVMPK